MDDEELNKTRTRESHFDQQAGQAQSGLMKEFWAYLRHNRKWWLAPIVLALLLLAGLVWLSGTAAGPFIYTLF